MYLLRGGRYVKLESNSMAGDRLTVWLENQHFNVLTEDSLNFEDKDEADF